MALTVPFCMRQTLIISHPILQLLDELKESRRRFTRLNLLFPGTAGELRHLFQIARNYSVATTIQARLAICTWVTAASCSVPFKTRLGISVLGE